MGHLQLGTYNLLRLGMGTYKSRWSMYKYLLGTYKWVSGLTGNQLLDLLLGSSASKPVSLLGLSPGIETSLYLLAGNSTDIGCTLLLILPFLSWLLPACIIAAPFLPPPFLGFLRVFHHYSPSFNVGT